MRHAETSGYLTHDDMSKGRPGEPVYIRKIAKEGDDGDKFTTNSLFEIESHTDFK